MTKGPKGPTILIDCVDQLKRVVAAHVTTPQGKHHRLGHMPTLGGWFCCCNSGKRCAQIKHVKALVPPMERREHTDFHET